MKAWQKFTAEELEQQYNPRLGRPDYERQVVPDWIARSTAFRNRVNGKLDLAYGNSERERLDFFPAENRNAPILMYFHGGYWQRGDKSLYSFIAKSFVKKGISVAVVNYDLCPAVTVAHIVTQARHAVTWLWQNAEMLGASHDQLFAMGHSAGGHITAMLMTTHWPSFNLSLPANVIKGGITLSGLFDLEPLCSTTINNNVGMDPQTARRNSPMNYSPTTDAPQLVVCGGMEPPEFHRQSDDYVAAFGSAKRIMQRLTVAHADHFSELDALVDESSDLFQNVLALVQSGGMSTR